MDEETIQEKYLPVKEVPPNSVIKLQEPVTCVEVRWEPLKRIWVKPGISFEVDQEFLLITHVLPNIEVAPGGVLVFKGWEQQVFKGVAGYSERILLIPGEMYADTFIILPEGTLVFVDGEGYETELTLVSKLDDTFTIMRNKGDGMFEPIYLRLT